MPETNMVDVECQVLLENCFSWASGPRRVILLDVSFRFDVPDVGILDGELLWLDNAKAQEVVRHVRCRKKSSWIEGRLLHQDEIGLGPEINAWCSFSSSIIRVLGTMSSLLECLVTLNGPCTTALPLLALRLLSVRTCRADRLVCTQICSGNSILQYTRYPLPLEFPGSDYVGRS